MTRLANDPLASARQAQFRASLRRFAREALPDAMVPGHVVVMDLLPTLPNGKVDRRALPAADRDEAAVASYVAPRDDVEAALARLWGEMLGVGAVGIEQSFFDLGGDSLAAVQMVARVREDFGVAVSMQRLFESPTVSQLAEMVRGSALGTGAAPAGSLSISAEELAAEADLPDDVDATGAAPPAGPPYQHILMTGATGFVGAFLLHDLLAGSTADVHVVVRADTADDALARVRGNLAGYGLWDDGFTERVQPVLGDLGRPYLGIAKGEYLRLADEIEVVVHNGAWSSFVLPYTRLKPINVLGTLELIRFACRSRVKPFHLVSSLAVFPGHRDVKSFYEVDLADADGVVGGYPQTKWVSDRMTSLAAERGLPVSIYRPGQITGASDTGAAPTELFVNAMMKGCIELGVAPDPDMMVEMVPVDFVGRAIAYLVLRGPQPDRVFHLPSPSAMHWVELIDLLAECGYPLRRVAYGEWFASLKASLAAGKDNALMPFLPLLGDDSPSEDLAYQNGNPFFDASHLNGALTGSGIECPPVGRALLEAYLEYFRSIGYIGPPQHAR